MIITNMNENAAEKQGAAESLPSNGLDELIRYMESTGNQLEIAEGMAFLKSNPWYVKALKADTLDRIWCGCAEELGG